MLRSARRNMLSIAAAFLLCGVLHVLLYGVEFFNVFSQLYCGTVTILGVVSVKKRVTNRRLRLVLLMISGSLLLYLVLQIARYSLFRNLMTAERYLWYAYYIPLLALPVLCLHLAALVHYPEKKPVPAALWAVSGAALLALAGILTNNLHQCFKYFPYGLNTADNQATNGWLYYLIVVFQFAAYVLAFGILLRKSRMYQWRLQWMTAVPMALGGLYFLLYPMGIDIRLFGTRIWNIGEILVFCMIAALEACIQVGLIPANTDYEKLFPLVDFPMAIFNTRGEPVYTSAVTRLPFPEQADYQVLRHPISGGYLEWEVDVGQINRLNRELEDFTQSIEARNNYLSAEAKTKAEKSKLETRNRIYDRITQIVRPQLDQITGMMEQHGKSFDQQLPQIAVLCAYIKRRSNMELLAEGGVLSSEECALAVTESLEYLRLCGVNTAMTSSGAERYPAGIIITAYEQLEEIVEDCLDTLSDLMVSLRFEKGQVGLRVLLNAGALTIPISRDPSGSSGVLQTLSVTKTDNDMLLAYTFREGGGEA